MYRVIFAHVYVDVVQFSVKRKNYFSKYQKVVKQSSVQGDGLIFL